jgi:ribonucleoside-diphosphate reductase beta chain
MNFSGAINWNQLEDNMDLEVWNRMTSNFWLPEKIALSNDIVSWSTMSEIEKDTSVKVFTGLTYLDHLQSSTGAPSLMVDAVTQHEEANLAFIGAMEAIHARSYSSVFATLCSSSEIAQAFEWAKNNKHLQQKYEIVNKYYDGTDPLMKKAASVFLESFMFYSGFYLPLKLSARKKLTNTADIIKLIIADEAVHGYYIGYKFQVAARKLSQPDRDELEQKVKILLNSLYAVETAYAYEIYKDIGWYEEVIPFLNYNANKALMNLGYDEMFDFSETQADPSVIAALTSDDNHDFFSGAGSNYVMGKAVDTDDSDWDF